VKFYSRSHDAVIRVYDAAGKVIETHEQPGEFKEPGADARKTLCFYLRNARLCCCST
jgi:hypothetical protein